MPPNMPFWQSNIKQKSAVASADSTTKLVQLVPGPANKSPPPSAMAAAMLKRCLRERIDVSFVAGENSRRPSLSIGARPSTRTPYTGKYRSFASPRQAGVQQCDHRARQIHSLRIPKPHTPRFSPGTTVRASGRSILQEAAGAVLLFEQRFSLPDCTGRSTSSTGGDRFVLVKTAPLPVAARKEKHHPNTAPRRLKCDLDSPARRYPAP